MQGELGLIAGIDTEVKTLPAQHVALCDTEQAAMRLCVSQATVYRTQENLSELLDMSVGTLNTILNSDQTGRQRYLGRTREIKLQQACGNRAIDQWAQLYEQGMLHCQKTKENRKAELLRQLQELEAS